MAIVNNYASLNEVKQAMSIPVSDVVDDTMLEIAIESASRSIDAYTGRNFYSSGTATRYFSPKSNYVCDTDDMAQFIEVKTTDSTDQYTIEWKTTDYQLEPLNNVVDGVYVPFTRIRAIGDNLFQPLNGEATVEVKAVFGYTPMPIQIKQACIIQASRLFKRLDSPLGVAGIGDLGVIRVSSRLDPDVAMLIDPYRKIQVG
jgi:phage gp36-like protein